MDNNYNVFSNENELPEGEQIIVVKPYDEDSDDFLKEEMLIGNYSNGEFTEDPNYFTAAEVTEPITKYVDDSKPVYVHEDVASAYEYAREFAEVFEECGGNLNSIADRLEEKMTEMCEFDEDNN